VACGFASFQILPNIYKQIKIVGDLTKPILLKQCLESSCQ